MPSFITIANLIKDEKYDPVIMHLCLSTLQNSLENFDNEKLGLINSVLWTIISLLRNVSKADRIVPYLFWLAIFICQTGHEGLFEGGISLLQTILEVFYHKFNYTGMYLPQILLQVLDELSGSKWKEEDLNFKSHFSLSVAVVLLPGLQNPKLRFSTIEALTDLLLLASNTTPIENYENKNYIMGYIIPLIATDAELNELFNIINDDIIERTDEDCFEFLLKTFLLQDNITILLQTYYLYRLLQISSGEGYSRIYQFVVMLINIKPEIFSLM